MLLAIAAVRMFVLLTIIAARSLRLLTIITAGRCMPP